VLLFACAKHFRQPLLASLIPLFTVGAYYSVGGAWHLTQVEGLVGLPMFGALALAIAATQQPKHRTAFAFLSGLSGSFVLLLKVVFLPLLLALWVIAFGLPMIRQRQKHCNLIPACVWPVTVGVALPIALTLTYFAWHGALAQVIYCFVQWPTMAVAQLPARGFYHLAINTLWFVKGFAPTLLLAGVWLIVMARRYAMARRTGLRLKPLLSDVDPLLAGMVAWLVLGSVVVLVQRLSWLEYHFVLFFAPLGVLAALGVDELLALVRSRLRGHIPNIAVTLVTALLFAPMLWGLLGKAARWASFNFTLTPSSQLRYQGAISPIYQIAQTEMAFLQEQESSMQKPAHNLFVFGHPVFYTLSGRAQTLVSNGWVIEQYLPDQWRQLHAELWANTPDYIFVTTDYGYRTILAAHATDLGHILQQRYIILRHTDAGTWYARKS
jgi:hypothetical protein